MYGAVLKAACEGKTLDEMKQTITLDPYKHFGQYDKWLVLKIEGMYKQVGIHRRGN